MEKNQLKAGALLTYISLFIGNVISLFYTPFMLRTLGQSQYGLYSLANSVVGYLTVLDFGFGSATIRYTAKYKAEGQEEKATIMYGMFLFLYGIIGVLVLVLGCVFAFFSEHFFAKGLTPEEISTVKVLIVLASVNLAVSFPFNVFTSIVTAYEKFVFLKITSLIRLLVNPLIYIPVLLFGYKSIGLIVATTILNVVFLSLNVWYCLFKLHIKIKFAGFDLSLLKEIVIYSFWIFIGAIVNQLWWNSGQLILGIFSTSASIAIFGLAMQFKTYFESFACAITNIFLPKMTTLDAQHVSDKTLSDYFIKIGRLQYVIIALITSGFILFGRQFISIWAGHDYDKAFYTTVIIFIPLSLIDTQTLGITILQAKNKHKFRSLTYLFVAIAAILLCIPFIKKYDVYGCAFATAFALIVGNLIIMNWFYSRTIHLNIGQFWLEIIKMTPGILSLAVVSFFLLKRLPTLSSYRLLLPAVLIYSIFYFIIVYFFSLNSYERSLLKFRK